jgi:sulfide:quinone oxidoreductase
MANILIAGGGFGGLVAAESLAKQIGSKHQITLVSRSRKFVFYPDLVRLAFGECKAEDITFDLREALHDSRVRFLEAEIARVNPETRHLKLAHGEFEGDIPYDYLILALGRRLATEQIPGFFEHAHHLLSVDGAIRFGRAVRTFEQGRAIIGQCPGARLPVPVYETAFALSRFCQKSAMRERVKISIVSPDPPRFQFGDGEVARALRNALDEHFIDYIPDFPIESVSAGSLTTGNGLALNFDLLLLLPPFRGPGAVRGLGLTDAEDYLKVDRTMRVQGVENIYAVGDCVNFDGPKMAHMAVNQAEVAAANLAAQLDGRDATQKYDHEMMLVIDEGGPHSIYLRKGLWDNEPMVVKQNRFWTWAKRVHNRFWIAKHS